MKPFTAEEIRTMSTLKRVKHFNSLTIAHPTISTGCDNLLSCLYNHGQNKLVFAIGPTGFGKSTLIRIVTKKITERLLPELQKDHERIPAIKVTAQAPEKGAFSFKSLYFEILKACDEIAPESKNSDLFGFAPRFRRRGGEEETDDLRDSVLQVLSHRRPVAVFLDEAQHIMKTGSGRKLVDQLDVLKSLVDATTVPIVMTGTYELNIFPQQNGQVDRRSIKFHLKRYDAHCAREFEHFCAIVKSFSQHLLFVEPVDLLKHADFLYERSLGCVGILRDLLSSALTKALSENSKTLTWEHLNSSALSITSCHSILAEITRGEEFFCETEASAVDLRKRLGLYLDSGPAPAKRPAKQKPGNRKPKRDKIGGAYDA